MRFISSQTGCVGESSMALSCKGHAQRGHLQFAREYRAHRRGSWVSAWMAANRRDSNAATRPSVPAAPPDAGHGCQLAGRHAGQRAQHTGARGLAALVLVAARRTRRQQHGAVDAGCDAGRFQPRELAAAQALLSRPAITPADRRSSGALAGRRDDGTGGLPAKAEA